VGVTGNTDKIQTTVYLTERQRDHLKILSGHTGVPVAVYIRRGIDTVLQKSARLLSEAIDAETARRLRSEKESR
jgi:predicted DNA-binding protein